jgi:hypothetical protein
MKDLSLTTEIVIFSVIIVVLACSIFFIFRFFKLQKTSDSSSSEDVLKDIENSIIGTLSTYNDMATQLHLTYVILGCIAIISSVFVTTFIAGSTTTVSYRDYLPFVSFASTASITLITAFNLGTKANSCRTAWRYLDYTFSRYKTGEITMAELLKAKFEAETILGGVDFQYNPK